MRLAELIADHGGILVLGLSVLLGLSACAVLRSRRVADRQRWAELGLLVGLLYVPLALAPLPRLPLDELFPAGRATHAPSAADQLRSHTRASVDRLLANVPAGSSWRGDDAASAEHLAQSSTGTSDGARSLDAASVARAREGLTALASTLAPAPVMRPAARGAPTMPQGSDPWPHPAVIVAWLYLAGVGLGAVRLLVGAWRLRAVVRDTRPAPASVTALLDERTVGSLSVDVRVTDRHHGPFCVGVRRPVIVIPARLLTDAGREALGPVLCHELAHATRRDGVGRWIAALALPCLWFHPLAWWLRARARRASELLADDLAAAHTSARRTARALVELASQRLKTPAPALHSSSVLDDSHDLTRRIDMLLNRTGRLDSPSSRGQRWLRNGLAAAALTLGTTLLGAPVQAQDARAAEEIAMLNEERDMLLVELESLQAMLAEMQQLMSDMQAVHADESFTDGEKLPLLGFLFDQRKEAETLAAMGYVGDDPTPDPATAAEPLLTASRVTREQLEQLQALGYLAEPAEPVEDPSAAEPESVPFLEDIPILSALLEPQPIAKRATSRPRAVAANPVAAPATTTDELAVSGAMLDLITRHIDMGTELAIKRRRIAEDEALVEGGFLSEGEWTATVMETEGLQLKRAITEQLLVAELEAAKVELDRLEDKSSPRVVRLRARIDIIASVLSR